MIGKPNSTEKVLDQHVRGLGFNPIRRLRAYFLAGILVTAPVGITLYLTWLVLSSIDSNVARLLPDDVYRALYGHTTFPGIGLLIAVSFFIIVGWFASNILGRILLRLSEYIMHRMPVIRALYNAIKQIVETVMTTQSQAFREVVLLEYPRKGVWSLGFVTGRTQGEVQRLMGDELINVFVATTPNPTSGFLLFVPRKDLHFLKMGVEEGIKLVVSGGIIVPPDRGEE